MIELQVTTTTSHFLRLFHSFPRWELYRPGKFSYNSMIFSWGLDILNIVHLRNISTKNYYNVWQGYSQRHTGCFFPLFVLVINYRPSPSFREWCLKWWWWWWWWRWWQIFPIIFTSSLKRVDGNVKSYSFAPSITHSHNEQKQQTPLTASNPGKPVQAGTLNVHFVFTSQHHHHCCCHFNSL